MTNPFRALPEPLRVHILFEIAHHVDQRTLSSMRWMFPVFGAVLKTNRGAMLELMDALTVPITMPEGTTWLFCGRLHRGHGLPAVESPNGEKEWWVNGKLHRDGGLPAIERANGGKKWWVHGKLHRDGDLPAIEQPNGVKEWLVNGKRHRGGGLPAIELVDGYKEWWINGIQQPEPASEWSKSKEWWVNDLLHRDGGLPAV